MKRLLFAAVILLAGCTAGDSPTAPTDCSYHKVNDPNFRADSSLIVGVCFTKTPY